MVVPIGVLGAITFSMLRGLPNDLYFKIGMITVIGLAAKNAILIVEFAVEQRAAGKSLREATLEAAHLRFRPILMTSFAFILGVLPLAISTGAGANARHSIGTGVIGGMVFATVLGLIFIRCSSWWCAACWARSWMSSPRTIWLRRTMVAPTTRIAESGIGCKSKAPAMR